MWSHAQRNMILVSYNTGTAQIVVGNMCNQMLAFYTFMEMERERNVSISQSTGFGAD